MRSAMEGFPTARDLRCQPLAGCTGVGVVVAEAEGVPAVDNPAARKDWGDSRQLPDSQAVDNQGADIQVEVDRLQAADNQVGDMALVASLVVEEES
jgi:hypothetical protein